MLLPFRNVRSRINSFDDIVDDFRIDMKNEFGKRFINIGLENIAVVAARVVELPPRCNNKRGIKRRCL